MSSRCTKDDIEKWLPSILDKENLQMYDVEVRGLSEKGDGFIGDVTFVTVLGETESGTKKKLDLVVKHGKPSVKLREALPVRDAFKNEIYVYDEILPAFRKLQKERGVQVPFDNVPRCFGTLLFDDMEVLFLQDMKAAGYVLHEKKNPMNFEHVSAVIRLYGKLHAISYALRDQKPDEFRKLCGNLTDVMLEFRKRQTVQEEERVFDQTIEYVEEQKELELAEKLKEYEKVANKFYDDTDPTDPYAVITHGDCWNNNFLFKYEDAIREKPLKVCLLDWQMCKLVSPVYDLSYFLFTCISPEDVHRLDEINDIYYESMSEMLKELGSDPQKMFPFKELEKQWKRFGKFGVTMMPTIFKIVLADRENIMDVAETIESGRTLSADIAAKRIDSEEYGKRTFNVLKLAVDRGFI